MGFRSLVLHLGAHKTGTSLVQKYLRDKEKLCARAGIWALPRGDGDQFIGWGKAAAVEAGGPGLLDSMAQAQARGIRHFVLSHENSLGRPFKKNAGHLYPDAERHAEHLSRVLGDQPVRVIYYLRHQAAFLESYYLQTMHEGAWHDFDNFRAGLGQRHGFSWAPVYEGLCAVFGAQNVVLRSFEADISAGQAAFLRAFMTSFTSDDLSAFGEFDYEPVRNPSLGTRGLELARGINPMLRNTAERRLFRKMLQTHFSNRDYPRPELLTPEQRAQITAQYEAENAQLIARSIATARAPA